MLERLLYPNVCGFCGKILKSGSICVKCMNNIPYLGLKYIPFKQNFFFFPLKYALDYKDKAQKKENQLKTKAIQF